MSPIATPKTLLAAMQYLSSHDSTLAPIIQEFGAPTIHPHNNYYQELVESIISQQLSVKAADTIQKRFLALFSETTFPRPDQIVDRTIEEFRSVGLSRQKAGYIQDLAHKIIDGTVHFDHLDTLKNDEIVDELTKVKGVGVWTAHMFLIFCMGRLDILPVGDLGIRNGIERLYQFDITPTTNDMKQIALDHTWHPYESIASWYIWRSLGNKPSL